jgi:anti-anti-sigma regulatory factor
MACAPVTSRLDHWGLTMAAPSGTVRVHQDGPIISFQVIGWGTMKQSLALRLSAERGLAQGASHVRVDLRHCTYLDSTFLGTLLALQRAARRQGGKQLVLVCPSAGCCRHFQQVGIDDAFVTEMASDPEPCDWQDLPSTRDDPCEFSRNVVQAHEELAGLGGVAGQTFGEVARQLRRECGPDPMP